MHRAWIVLALATLLAQAPPAAAQETRPQTRPGDLARLIEQLDSDDFATRERATRELMAMGAGAREALRAAREAGSLERRARIETVLQGIDVFASSRPARKEATRVSVEADGKPLSQVLAALSASSGNLVRTRPGADPVVTLTVRDVPFFEAIDRICAATGRRIGWDMRERGIMLDPAAEKGEPVVYAGPLRISLVAMMLSRTIRFAGGADPQGHANLQIRVDAEERSQALGVLMPIRVKEFLDDQKRSLRWGDGAGQQVQQSQYLQRTDQRRQLQCFIQMSAPQPDVKTIARLEFTLAVILPTELYEAEIGNPDAGAEAGEGAFHVTIEDWKENGAQREVKLAITRPFVTNAALPGQPIQDDVVTFHGTDGQLVTPVSTGMGGGSGLVYTAALPIGAKVGRIRVSCLKQFEIVEFPVVFENVRLP
jgi:hypothetical protein